jgi:hypothetical protein
MHAANPLWGAPRIHGELQKLGIDIAQSTVAKYLARYGGQTPSQTWRSFLSNHISELASIDFFTVPTATFRVLFVFVVLSHDRRRIVHVNVTAHPTAAWTAQQLREAWPWDTVPRFVIRDRDGIYGSELQHAAQAMGIEEVLTAPLRSTRMLQFHGPCSRRPAARSSRSRTWVVCIITTNVAPPDHPHSGRHQHLARRPHRPGLGVVTRDRSCRKNRQHFATGPLGPACADSDHPRCVRLSVPVGFLVGTREPRVLRRS